jgi:arsenate reductase (glutaredoxin)
LEIKFYQYPKCSTCQKAKKWLEKNEVNFEEIDITEHPPDKKQMKEIYEKSGLPLKKFFNTSGKKYRELNIKERIGTASEDELLELLSSDGMLIKRPVAYDGENVTVGFKEEAYETAWK